ncbi:hypothetical protein DFH08DRAFT_960552 [Mycena albidolilacea]|uniref:Uncharacterized protein n=1 Tax=Mycena albidolilacea TaxID=1033008 RepID=A0AAD7A0N2_9AGAR|nr:hypothetical protein DFH08DRAFT_960552 [Mycena albidolilacea]
MIYGAISGIQATLLLEQELLSRINENTTISGFYSPGTWWAWLITLGMTHGHTLVGWLNGEEQRAEWDYDLIGASATGGGSWGRTVGVAIIPLIFTVVASGFAANAHEAIKRTDLVLWCRMHNGIDIGKKDITLFLAIDFPAMMGLAFSSLFQIWRSPADALRYSAHSALASVLLWSLAPLFGAYATVVAAFK